MTPHPWPWMPPGLAAIARAAAARAGLPPQAAAKAAELSVTTAWSFTDWAPACAAAHAAGRLDTLDDPMVTMLGPRYAAEQATAPADPTMAAHITAVRAHGALIAAELAVPLRAAAAALARALARHHPRRT